MDEPLRCKRRLLVACAVCCLYVLNSSFCLSLNVEGVALLRFKERIESDPFGALSNWVDEVGVASPCSWSGIECSESGNVIILNLKDLCLRGTLAPDIGNLVHLQYINLRHNLFYDAIPGEVANLKELEVLDLGYNNFSGQIPSNLGSHLTMMIPLLDNNELLRITDPKTHHLQNLSEVQVDENLLSNTNEAPLNSQVVSCNSRCTQDVPRRKLLQGAPIRIIPGWRFIPPPLTQPQISSAPNHAPSPKPVSAPSPSPSSEPPRAQARSNESPHLPPPSSSSPFMDSPVSPSSSYVPEDMPRTASKGSETKRKLIISAAVIGTVLLLLAAAAIILCRSGKVATVRPWRSGLSGQLQRAFVTGVPKLKRSELEAACEDFSNVIGSSSNAIYKGTLSSGVEIAVASVMLNSKEWSTGLESQFRKKIETLSKVNHKNFVSIVGYCEEEEPFTRMLVFEYAPNGTLFEHLHIREAEHLDWTMRLRIAMGMAYCLEHMHQLSPPLILRNLTSSSVYLTEDYASKVADFVLWGEGDEKHNSPESNVYNFGVILFEMVTGKLPYSVGSDTIDHDWASDYLRGEQQLRDMVDPTLKTYREDQLLEIGDVIKSCVDPSPRRRLSMNEICERLREITGITPNGAVPKLSPLWWAELEILSTEAN